jgi:mono/diheme cytochrome c family protein
VQALTQRALIVTLALGCVATAVVAQTRGRGNPEAAKIKNPVAADAASIASGRDTYQRYCASCHGADGKGGIVNSLVEDRGGPPTPDLTDDQWDFGSSDGEIFSVVKNGTPPDLFMGPWDGRLTDTEMWNVVNYVRSLAAKKK